ncbi:Gfo/Idh/MocA family protein [Nonomuraea guangzhouensis]|uniref:Gfo/Idh/MocA family protein n=1 Tax=Nonomuraea guangzhouensis TaxID=1291555 RepID=A0ABW4G8C6_9ACTN|nr:Gfo/Idh/MocA family oxidoreductase [Nonomuraea guangzhouensis]
MTLGIGIIGAGPVTQAIHLPTIAGLSDRLRVTHVMDVDAGTAAAVAARAGAAHSTTVEQLLADPAVDLVAVCSPHPFHAEQAAAACRAGKKGVLVEKPLATTLDEAHAIAEASRDTGVPVVVGAMHTYDPAWLAAERAWGDLPETVHRVRSRIILPPNARFESAATQLHTDPVFPARGGDPAAAIRGAILGLAIHNLPLVRRFLPEIESVDLVRPLQPFGYVLTLRGGGRTAELIGYLHGGWRTEWTFEAWGDDGELRLDFTPSYVPAGSATAELRTGAGTRLLGPYPGNGYAGEWRHLAAVATGAEPVRYGTTDLVADLAYALNLADRATALLRQGATP